MPSGPASIDPVMSGGASHSDYEALLSEAKSLGLYERTYWHYGACAAVGIAGILTSLYVITLTNNPFLEFFNAIVFGFFSVQIGMIGHDLSHAEVFVSPGLNRFFSSFAWGLWGGLSEKRWFVKHNQHHVQPNHIGHDPDLGIPFMFTDGQVATKSPFLRRWLLPYQHVIFWPSLAFVYPWNIMLSMQYYLSDRSPRAIVELLLVCIHFAVLFYFVFAFLSLPVAVLFLITAFVVIGIYMGFVFAPNHKGRPELGENEKFLWTHQIALTRDLHPSWILFYICGGLNYQIEHHLFPSMSRAKYLEARPLVQKFCRQNGIEYHETSWVESLREMHTALKAQAMTVSARS